MSVYVNTNVTSLRGQNSLDKSTRSLDTTYNRLSTGLRINSAKDDSAGLQISDRLTSQINGLNQGNRNANDGIALAQTCEGAMDEITSMLQRVRTLAVQAANGTNTDEDREAIQKEVNHLCAEITRISCQSTFAGKTFLNGNPSDGSLLLSGCMKFHVGSNQNDTISFSLTGGFSLASIRTQAAIGGTTNTVTSGLAPTDDVGTYTALSVSTAANAELVLQDIDSMIQYVDGKRADLGAIQNRLESTIRNQSNIAANEADARSRIRDTDYAEEASNLSSQSIIQQAAASMLTQANTRPQLALSLLG